MVHGQEVLTRRNWFLPNSVAIFMGFLKAPQTLGTIGTCWYNSNSAGISWNLCAKPLREQTRHLATWHSCDVAFIRCSAVEVSQWLKIIIN